MVPKVSQRARERACTFIRSIRWSDRECTIHSCRKKMRKLSKRPWRASDDSSVRYDDHDGGGDDDDVVNAGSTTADAAPLIGSRLSTIDYRPRATKVIQSFIEQTGASDETARTYTSRAKYVLHEALSRYAMDQQRATTRPRGSGAADDEYESLSLASTSADQSPVVARASSSSLSNSWDMVPVPAKYGARLLASFVVGASYPSAAAPWLPLASM